MKRVYSHIRIGLMTFAIGLATVYFWNGISIGIGEMPMALPRINSEDEVLFVFASTALDASPYYIAKDGEIVNGRNLSLYDEGGYIESCGVIDELAGCLRQREAARRFIFDHWAKKRSGYIQVGHPCVDCSPVDHIFIEPDSTGKMRIVITLETNGPFRTNEASKLRFREANMEEKRRTDSSVILVFIDRNGKEIDYF